MYFYTDAKIDWFFSDHKKQKKIAAAFRDIPNHRPLIGNGAGPKIGWSRQPQPTRRDEPPLRGKDGLPSRILV